MLKYNPLKVGLLIDDISFCPRWIEDSLSYVLRENIIDIVKVITPKNKFVEKEPFSKKLSFNGIGRRIYWRFNSFDYSKFVSPESNGPDAQKSINNPFNIDSAHIYEVDVLRKSYYDHFSDDAISNIKDLKLDVILRFGFRILRGEILNVARLGIWSFHHGDPSEFRGGPAGFWETYQDKKHAGFILQRLKSELDAGEILASGNVGVVPFSPAMTRNRLLWAGGAILVQALKAAQRGLPYQHHSAKKIQKKNGKIYREPSIFYSIGIIVKTTYRRLKELNRFKLDHWYIILNKASKGDIFSKSSKTTLIKAPKGAFWADPCLFEYKDNIYLFFENYDYIRNIANIQVARVNKNTLSIESPSTVIDEKFHLSNPILIEEEGKIYLIPESSQSGNILLYECDEFPYKWKSGKVLINSIHAADPVLFKKYGFWWLFCTIAPKKGTTAHSCLNLWYSKSLDGPWEEHPMNPIVNDINGGRMAGKIFERVENNQSKIIRPAQSALEGYGSGIMFFEILTLTPKLYKEKLKIAYSGRDLGYDGVHAYSNAGDIEAIDVKKRVFKSSVIV